MMSKLRADAGEVSVGDGDQIIEAAEQLGTPFGCRAGMCGTCRIEVLEGMENLEPRNEREVAMGLEDSPFRLACQCKIRKGMVKIQI